jgi:anti-sigma-K factor RskA
MTPAESNPDLRSAEYALGVLDADERAAFEADLRNDPALRETLGRWERRLAPLADDIPAVDPPPRVWTRIQYDLGFLPPSPVSAPARAAARGPGWWSSLALWRWTAAGASAAAIALLAVNLSQQEKPPTQIAAAPAYMVATIARPDGIAHWTATIDLQRARMVVTPAVKPSVAAGRSTELWLIPANAKPIPLGVFPPDAPATMQLPPQVVAQIDARAVLAVSIEPPGGSPTGQPTGPVVATGAMRTAT